MESETRMILRPFMYVLGKIVGQGRRCTDLCWVMESDWAKGAQRSSSKTSWLFLCGLFGYQRWVGAVWHTDCMIFPSVEIMLLTVQNGTQILNPWLSTGNAVEYCSTLHFPLSPCAVMRDVGVILLFFLHGEMVTKCVVQAIQLVSTPYTVSL